jgi:hypothetical protein
VVTPGARNEAFYRTKLQKFESLSHLTIEVRAPEPAKASHP